MTFFVECGNSLTVNYGDMDEAFYDAVNGMYRRAIKKVLTLPEERHDEFKERFEAIMRSSSILGGGTTICFLKITMRPFLRMRRNSHQGLQQGSKMVRQVIAICASKLLSKVPGLLFPR
jgi:hypothetical protein